jgi:hypothetical protein
MTTVPATVAMCELLYRRILLVALAVLFLVLAWHAIVGGIRQMPRAITVEQRVETAIQMMCGILSVCVVLSLRWQRLAVHVRRAWGASLVAAVGLSSVVWGPPMLLVTVAFVLASVLAAWLMVRGLAIALDEQNATRRQQHDWKRR